MIVFHVSQFEPVSPVSRPLVVRDGDLFVSVVGGRTVALRLGRLPS